MAPQKKKKLKGSSASRVAKASKEMLIEGAASMSGKRVKDIAQSMVSGALMAETAATNKIRRKAQRKQFLKSLRKTKKEFKVEVGEPKIDILKDVKKEKITVGRPVMVKSPINKKTKNKMKKDSAFKMKGFSGFGNESPTKQKFNPYKKDNEAHRAKGKASDDLARKINKTYLDGGGDYDNPSSKTGKLMTQWNKGLKELDASQKDISKKNRSFNAYMDKVKSVKKVKRKKGKITQTPKPKPTRTQKIKSSAEKFFKSVNLKNIISPKFSNFPFGGGKMRGSYEESLKKKKK